MGAAEQIAALEAALERGFLEAQDASGRRVKYHSLKDMTDALSSLNAQVASETTTGFKFSKLKAPGPRG